MNDLDTLDHHETLFEDRLVRLDGGRFERCIFRNVVLEYGGGPVHLSGCRFEGAVRWQFTGDLGRGLVALGRLYADRQAIGLKAVVDTMFPADPA
ncbi:hypothetical protein GVO57_05755 [Sphingomonas changnyeongensis]|uniref:Pentapeptide repeat-containing protein n=1 Tax=Sphingomonas changnyeongensis TaxID=2698679 RepID=A0A7Z2S963_9SPHN|nr:hypothetical protein [Sphingomonas changnyeongensis]QHL90434.1 hypothetical protein GVO57_05755 [Sphingomonas changnyeongensis]